MQAVAANTGFVEFVGERVEIGELRMRAMKRGVEAGDLRQAGTTQQESLDQCQAVRLMQGRKRHELVEQREDMRVDHHRCGEMGSTMHDTMPHGLNGCLVKLFEHPLDGILMAANVTLRSLRLTNDLQSGTVANGGDRAGYESAECWVLSAEC